MKLALFSQEYRKVHEKKLEEILGKRFDDVSLLFINTAINYKPFKPDWYLTSENWYRDRFKMFREFEIERAFQIDSKFDFKDYFSKFDFIVFSGGNTFLLAYWLRHTGAGVAIDDLVRNNKVVCGGESAGACVLTNIISPYSTADDPSKAPKSISKGLGLIDFAIVPHWGLADFKTALAGTEEAFNQLGVETIRLENDEGLFISDGKKEIV